MNGLFHLPFESDCYRGQVDLRIVDKVLAMWLVHSSRLALEETPVNLPDIMERHTSNLSLSIALHIGALETNHENPLSSYHLLRDSILSIIRFGNQELPDDAIPQNLQDSIRDLCDAFFDWISELEEPPPPHIPNQELLQLLVGQMCRYGQNSWPIPADFDGPQPFSILDLQDEDNRPPPVKSQSLFLRLPIAIGAIIRHRERWDLGLNNDFSTLDVADPSQVLAHDILEVKKLANWMNENTEESFGWGRELLPLNSN